MKDLLIESENGISENPPETDVNSVLKNFIKNTLKEETKSEYENSIKILRTILKNIIDHPEEEKYRSIKVKNPKFHNALGKYESAIHLLEFLGFELINDIDPCYIYSYSEINLLR